MAKNETSRIVAMLMQLIYASPSDQDQRLKSLIATTLQSSLGLDEPAATCFIKDAVVAYATAEESSADDVLGDLDIHLNSSSDMDDARRNWLRDCVRSLLALQAKVRKSRDMRDASDFLSSSRLLVEVLQEAPNAGILWGLLGCDYRKLAKNDDAEAAFRSCLCCDPARSLCYFFLGTLLFDKQRFAEALDSLMRGYQISANDSLRKSLFNLYLGLTYTELGAWDAAEEQLREGTLADASNDEIWTALGNLLSRRGQLREARDAYKTALALDPTNQQSHAMFPWIDAEQRPGQ